GDGAQYPYPKHVWSPAGGWWTRPANWRSNTAITFAGMLAVAYGVFTVSAGKERRDVQPDRPIPSMMVCFLFPRGGLAIYLLGFWWARQYRDTPAA
ncbi:hypothetical protein BJ138DRAFT_1021427, partial [Hygrophoropsis aurantiaca]